MRSFLVPALLAVALSVLSGCASIDNQDSKARIAVTGGTVLYIERARDPAKKAAKVLEAVEKAETMLDLQYVSVSDIRVALVARVVAQYADSPGERLLALEAVNAVADEVEARIGKGHLDPQARVRVNTVLGWVKTTASVYVPH